MHWDGNLERRSPVAKQEESMKSARLLVTILVAVISTVAFTQSDAPKSVALASSEAQKSFDKLKTLAGIWEGTFEGAPLHITLRVTSMGNTLMHEMKGESPEDPITMIHLDGDQLVLTHYCDAGNQPHMVATTSPDGKTITFNFISASNLLSSQMGHMQRVTFNFIDPDHHTEKWEFAMADGKTEGGLLDLKRSK
jgi:hypothetical protein